MSRPALEIETKRQAIKNFIDAFNTGNTKLLDDALTTDATYTFYGTTGFAGVNNALSQITKLGRDAFPEGIKFDIKQIIIEEDFGCVQWEDLATKKGRKYHNYGVFFVHFRATKIEKLWEYIDYERFKAFLEYDNLQRGIGETVFK